MIIPTSNDIKTVTDMREDTINMLNSVAKRKNPYLIFHRNDPKAVLISIKRYNQMIEMIEDYLDEPLVQKLESLEFNKDDYITEEEVKKELNL